MSAIKRVRIFGLGTAAALVIALASTLALQANGRRELAQRVEEFEAAVGPLDTALDGTPAINAVDNAAVWLAKGARAFVWTDEDRDLVNRLLEADHPPASWSAAERTELHAFLERNRPAFDLMQRSVDLTQASHCQAFDPSRQELLPLVPASRAVWVHGRMSLADGDWDSLRADMALLSRLAVTLEAEPVVIHLLVGLAIEKFQLALFQEAVGQSSDVAQLKSLRDLMSYFQTTC